MIMLDIYMTDDMLLLDVEPEDPWEYSTERVYYHRGLSHSEVDVIEPKDPQGYAMILLDDYMTIY